jgi:hypothetical protein
VHQLGTVPGQSTGSEIRHQKIIPASEQPLYVSTLMLLPFQRVLHSNQVPAANISIILPYPEDAQSTSVVRSQWAIIKPVAICPITSWARCGKQ